MYRFLQFMKNEIEKHLQQLIDKKIPKHLQSNYSEIISAFKSGFYEGIKFERSKYKGMSGVGFLTHKKK